MRLTKHLEQDFDGVGAGAVIIVGAAVGFLILIGLLVWAQI